MTSVGFDLRPFDAATGRAGDMVVSGVVPPIEDPIPDDPRAAAHSDRIRYLFLPFGWTDADDTADPQWNFVLPLGTHVLALVDGEVCEVTRLYSGDFTIRVAPAGRACADGVYFETEHVNDPIVSGGDQVTAGQHIATVSAYQADWRASGYGVVEIGVAFPTDSGPPLHLCPTLFLEPSIKTAMIDALASVMDAWAVEFGDATLYADAADPELGCFVREVRA